MKKFYSRQSYCWDNFYINYQNASLSPIRRMFAPGLVDYKKRCTRFAAASNKVYQLLAHGRWFSPASSFTKTGRHDIAEILLKVALNTKIQIQIYQLPNSLSHPGPFLN
jgi:hypothetical protein